MPGGTMKYENAIVQVSTFGRAPIYILERERRQPTAFPLTAKERKERERTRRCIAERGDCHADYKEGVSNDLCKLSR
jgi:hypothetical protein